MKHRKTWLLWINQLSPISPTISNVSLGEREALAQALAMAAPQGPAGVQCVDECNCGADVPTRSSLDLYGELSSAGWTIDAPDNFIARARNAIQLDLVSPSPRIEFPTRSLTDVDVVVSDRSSRVAVARALFPRTWRVVAEETAEKTR